MKEANLLGSGLVESLYHYLWMKDRLNNSASLHLDLPDTVIYRNGKPCYWYFTARDGSIKRKVASNLTETEVQSAFLSPTRARRSDIVAVFMYSAKNVSELYEIELRTHVAVAMKDGMEAGGTRTDELQGQLRRAVALKGSSKVIFEYFNEAGLGTDK